MPAETPVELDRPHGNSAVERQNGIDTHVVGAHERRDLAPYPAPRFLGAAFCPLEGQIDPMRGTAALLALAKRAGARVARDVSMARPG